MQMQQRRVQQYSSEEDASPRAAAPVPSPVIRQRSDGKPERQAAKRFKSAVQLHGEHNIPLLRTHCMPVESFMLCMPMIDSSAILHAQLSGTCYACEL